MVSLMRRKKLDLKYRILIIIAIIILIVMLLNLTIRKNHQLNPVESFIKDSLIYTGNLLSSPFKFIGDKINDYQELKNIQKEYDIIKKNVDAIDLLKTENLELKSEIKALKEELKIDYVLSDYEYLNASIIERNVGYWYNTITIDKGSYNGVKKDMAIINNHGLVGKVISTTAFTSTVKLLTTTDINNKTSVSIYHEDKKLYGVIVSYDYQNNLFTVEGISNSDKIEIGDQVYTSGLGGVFPSGILIGEVDGIDVDSYSLSKILKIKPSVDFNNITYVVVASRTEAKK